MTKSHSTARRHIIIPDTQIRPGVPLEHIGWAAQAIVDYKPDVIVVIGDWWDMPSCSKHNLPGSKQTEGTRVQGGHRDRQRSVPHARRTDGGGAAARCATYKRSVGTPRKVFTFGNHEFRVDRAVSETPKPRGDADARRHAHAQLRAARVPGDRPHRWDLVLALLQQHAERAADRRHDPEPIEQDPARSFVQGHQQGFSVRLSAVPCGKLVRHGLVAGSFYLHDETYRDVQSNGTSGAASSCSTKFAVTAPTTSCRCRWTTCEGNTHEVVRQAVLWGDDRSVRDLPGDNVKGRAADGPGRVHDEEHATRSAGESFDRRVAVAAVTLNRADGNVDKVCGAVYEKAVNPSTGKKEAAFSWTLGAAWRAKGPVNEKAMRECELIARAVLAGELHSRFDSSVKHYHTVSVHPDWHRRFVDARSVTTCSTPGRQDGTDESLDR